MGFLDRFRRQPEPTGAETATIMIDLAETFRTGTARLGWERTEAARLDGLCEGFLATNPPAENKHTMIMGLGAYLGELLVRHGGGRWEYDPNQKAAVVAMPNGLQAYPHNKVAKRLEHGPEHSLLAFYQYGLAER